MLHHPTLDKLQALRFTGMVKALTEQAALPEIDQLSFEERLGLLVDREMTERADRQLQTRLRQAKLKHNACVEDIDYKSERTLDQSLIRELVTGRWIQHHLNLIILGPAGVGKTWIACALANKACRDGYRARYLRLPRLLESLPIAKGDGSYAKLLLQLAKMDVLILDDWGLAPLTAEQRRDLLEILEDRNEARSTIITSQLPIDQWHDMIGDPTIADAILDRLVHSAYKMTLKGESMRKKKQLLTDNTLSQT